MNTRNDTMLMNSNTNKLNNPGAKISEEYHSALACFSDDTLTNVYNLVVNSGGCNEAAEVNGDSKACQSNVSKLLGIYNDCKASSATIARIEATPGFNNSVVSPATNRSHMMNIMLNAKSSSTSALLPWSQIRRGAIPAMERGTSMTGNLLSTGKFHQPRRTSISSSSSSASTSTGHPHHHHLQNNYNHQTGGRKLKQQQRSGMAPPPPPPPPFQGHKSVSNSIKDGKDTNDESIPESALNFLAALNKKKLPVLSKRSLKGGKKQSRKNLSKSVEVESSSSGITDHSDKDEKNQNESEDQQKKSEDDDNDGDENEEELDSSDDESDQSDQSVTRTKRRRTQIISSKSRKKRQRRRTARSNKINYSDDYLDKDSNESNDEQPEDQPEEQPEERLKGSPDVIYEVGDEVAVYFEKDDEWYEATIRHVEFKNVAKTLSERANRANKRSSKARNDTVKSEGNNDAFELKVLNYIVEYGNGEIQKMSFRRMLSINLSIEGLIVSSPETRGE